jgi:integrase
MREYNEFIQMKKDNNMSPNTIRNYNGTISKLFTRYNISAIEDFRKLKLIDFEKFLIGLHVQASSYNTNLANLKSFTSWLKKHNYIDEDYVSKIELQTIKDSSGNEEMDSRKMTKQNMYLTEEERQAMFYAAKGLDFKLSLCLMMYMGLRREEVVNVRVKDIHDDYLAIRGKNGTFIEREMPPVVKTLVEKYLAERKSTSEYLIVSKVGGHNINTNSIYKRVKSVGKKAGIDPKKLEVLAPHGLRRTLACLLVLENTPVYVVQDTLRHKRIDTTMLYLRPLKNVAANKALISQPMPNMENL